MVYTIPEGTMIERYLPRIRSGVTPRWLLDEGLVVIPKSGSHTHLKENSDVFDWSLPEDALARIKALGD